MSTVTVQTISNGTVSTSSANVIQGSAKAWLNYNPNTSSIKASYNVSSVTVVSTNVFTINFTNALADANYAVGAFANFNAGIQAIVSADTTYTKTSSAFQFAVANSASGIAATGSTDVGIVILR
jgi:hypothetical protein